MHKNLLSILSFVASIIVIAFTIQGCCDDKESNLPVSDEPIAAISCDSIDVTPTTQLVGKPVQIQCSEDFQKVDIVWGDSEEIETIVKTNSTIVGYHLYASAGTYIVRVKAYNTYGYQTTCQGTITISGNNDPVTPDGVSLSINANPTYGKPPLTVNFSYNFSAEDGASVKTSTWDFGDGNTSTIASPQNIYDTAGSYNVQLTILDTSGRTSTAVTTISVKTDPTPDPGNQSPSVTISSDKVSVDVTGTVHFTASASDPDGTIANYDWVLGDGDTDNGASKTSLDHLYYNTGGATCNAYCIVTDDDGATAQSNTITITVKANEKPVVVSEVNGEPWNAPEVEEGDTVSLDLCGSTDSNVGDSIKKWEYTTTAGLNPLSGSSTTNCTFSPTSVGTGEKSVVFHVTDSYGQASNAQSRKFTVVKTAHCEYAGIQVSKVTFSYGSITWNSCTYLPTDRYQNNPPYGSTYKKVICNLTTDVPNVIVGEGQALSGSTSVTWMVKVLGTNCNTGDTLPVYTLLSGAKSGDTNANQELVNITVGQNYNYNVTINALQSGLRTWRLYVSGIEAYNTILRNDIE